MNANGYFEALINEDNNAFKEEINNRAKHWTHGLDAAIKRLANAHCCSKPEARFDARDREALAFVLAELIKGK